MDANKALQLSYDLRRQSRGGFKLRADIENGRIVFTGGTQGAHSIDVGVSSKERILAHWEGYCENNGMPLPQPGEKIHFVGNNGCLYYGTVTNVGPKRVGVDFKFRHGGSAHANVPHSDLRFQVRPLQRAS